MNRVIAFVVLAVVLVPVFAEPVTPDRLGTLPAAEQSAWQKYLERSQATARADQAALQAEVTASGMTAALPAPDGGDFKLPAPAGDAYYAGDEAKTLADIIISYQAPCGGWSKHTAYSKGPRKPGMQWTSQNQPGEPAHYLATFDNRSTTEQLYFLAYGWNATKREDCKAACIKGLNFILGAQYSNGGWPQVYPLEGKYHDDITFNDDAMTRILRLLQSASGKDASFSFLNDAQRAKAADAIAAGIQCVLKTQVELNGKKTVWCAQYDPITLEPSSARKMEPATLSGAESARVLEFLMSIDKPSPEVIACIESGLAWFEQAKITGISKTSRDGKTTYEPNPNSTEVYWARFYDLKTGKPIFPGRDGVVYDTFEAMAAKNKVGYDYYTTQPSGLLNSVQKKWRKTLSR
jgi:PelA/Pel-15E family pectate lyase